MTYFCFIETARSTPHMEPLQADHPDQARAEAEALLAQHESARAAHVFLRDTLIASIEAAGRGPSEGRSR